MADQLQQRVIELQNGSALLLAGPGCGKTHILAKRVVQANAVYGVDFSDMLCLTFTNRAAREMESRIISYLGVKPKGLFIGNLHRFCLHFLFENELIAPDTSILDEEDLEDFLATALDLHLQKEIRHFLDVAAYIYQTEQEHPANLIRRPQALPTATDYDRVARFEKFKKDNRLIDFDRILLSTYTALLDRNAVDYKMTGYRWVQVDEVQDLTSLQLAIIDLVSSRIDRTILYLGDEQQAIFRFLGAGGRALEGLKRHCHGNILHLQRNYRSPRHLVEMCNDLASTWLDIDSEILPHSVCETYELDSLVSYQCEPYALTRLTAAIAKQYVTAHPEKTTAILVRTNFESDRISEELERQGIEHFKVSRRDIFKQNSFKTIWSHIAVTSNPFRYQEWARLLYQTRSIRTLAGARSLVSFLRDASMGVDELFDFGSSTNIQTFGRNYEKPGCTFTVFDTETTGLNVNEDDIIQIAAVKIRNGKLVPGSEFSIIIDTQRRIPPFLSNNLINPMVELYRNSERVSAEKGFSLFLEYVGNDDIVAGHNLSFDLSILRSNIEKRTRLLVPEWITEKRRQTDTLALSHLLYPRLWSHKLADLINVLGLEGVNSHVASDDVAATVELMKVLYKKAKDKAHLQIEILHNAKIARIAQRFKDSYHELWLESRRRFENGGSTLAAEMATAHDYFANKDLISKIPRFEKILELVDKVIVDSSVEKDFRSQCLRHLHDMLCYTESDLLINGIATERLSVMTVHKAKGLEMDNVIIYDAIRRNDTLEDFARWLYVACSRAKKRLAIGISGKPDAVISSISRHFKSISPTEQRALTAQYLIL